MPSQEKLQALDDRTLFMLKEQIDEEASRRRVSALRRAGGQAVFTCSRTGERIRIQIVPSRGRFYKGIQLDMQTGTVSFPQRQWKVAPSSLSPYYPPAKGFGPDAPKSNAEMHF